MLQHQDQVSKLSHNASYDHRGRIQNDIWNLFLAVHGTKLAHSHCQFQYDPHETSNVRNSFQLTHEATVTLQQQQCLYYYRNKWKDENLFSALNFLLILIFSSIKHVKLKTCMDQEKNIFLQRPLFTWWFMRKMLPNYCRVTHHTSHTSS